MSSTELVAWAAGLVAIVLTIALRRLLGWLIFELPRWKKRPPGYRPKHSAGDDRRPQSPG